MKFRAYCKETKIDSQLKVKKIGRSHSVEIYQFSSHLILREINFGCFSGGQNLPFRLLWRLLILILVNSEFEMSGFSKNTKFTAAKMVKMAIFWASKSPEIFHVESEWHKNPGIFTLWVMIHSVEK